MEVGFLWTWRDSHGVDRQSFVFPMLHHVFSQGIPRPPGLDEADEDIYKRLLAVATLETELRKTPCQYLGVETSQDKYEADPSKWPARSYPRSKTHALVYYEWEHVLCEGLPHRCSVSAHDLLHHQRPVPGHPLKRSACSNLTFSIEFMKAVAANVHAGVQFKGVAYDQERASIVEHLPHEGVDIQDEPLFWVLPDGRCECWSVRRLHEALPDMLVHASDDTLDEAYNHVADAFGYEILGKASDEDIDALRAEPGRLRDKFWEKYSWTRPVDESVSCWWVASPLIAR